MAIYVSISIYLSTYILEWERLKTCFDHPHFEVCSPILEPRESEGRGSRSTTITELEARMHTDIVEHTIPVPSPMARGEAQVIPGRLWRRGKSGVLLVRGGGQESGPPPPHPRPALLHSKQDRELQVSKMENQQHLSMSHWRDPFPQQSRKKIMSFQFSYL